MDIKKAEKRRSQFGSDTFTVELNNGNIMCIPESEDNRDYQELKKQEREGKIVISEREV